MRTYISKVLVLMLSFVGVAYAAVPPMPPSFNLNAPVSQQTSSSADPQPDATAQTQSAPPMPTSESADASTPEVQSPPQFVAPTQPDATSDDFDSPSTPDESSDASTPDASSPPQFNPSMPNDSVSSAAPTFTPTTPAPATPTPAAASSSDTSEHEPKGQTVTSGINFESTDKEQDEIDQAVDTLNVKTGGNWLLKRVWWEKTEDVYEQIKDVFNKVMDTRMQFISERNKLDRELDIFYGEMGIEQGPLQDVLSHAQDLMDKEKKDQGYLDKKERAFVQKLQGKERDLEQLKLDVKAIQELDNKIDEALDTLFKQIDVCNQYEQKAWDNFKEIARELNDKEARKLYYDTQGLYKDIQKVQGYISGEFATYFHQTIQSARDHTTKISSQINSMKSEGVDLIKEAEILEKDEPEPKKDDKKDASKEKKTSQGWFSSIGSFFSGIRAWFFNLLPNFMQKWFASSEKTVAKEDDKASDDPTHTTPKAHDEDHTKAHTTDQIVVHGGHSTEQDAAPVFKPPVPKDPAVAHHSTDQPTFIPPTHTADSNSSGSAPPAPPGFNPVK